MHELKFASLKGDSKSLMNAADKLQSMAREARLDADDKKEEEATNKRGPLPTWIE